MRRICTVMCGLLMAAQSLMGQSAAPAAAAPAAKAPYSSFSGPAAIVYPNELAKEDTRVDMYFGDWHDSQPRPMFGSLVVRDILTRGDLLTPRYPGEILQQATFLSYATLAAGERTEPTTLKGLQVFFYVQEGQGELVGDGKTLPVHAGTGFLVPEGLEFTLRNNTESQLVMYIIGDPTFAGFVPKKTFLIKEENSGAPKPVAAATTPGSAFVMPGAAGHWGHITHGFFNRANDGGLASIGSIITVEIAPLTLGEPHPHLPGKEEVWCEISGDSVAFVGPQVRMQHPGQAYLLRPDGLTTHSNINIDEPGTKMIKFLWFSTNTGISAGH